MNGTWLRHRFTAYDSFKLLTYLLKDNNLLPLKYKGQTQEKAVAKVKSANEVRNVNLSQLMILDFALNS